MTERGWVHGTDAAPLLEFLRDRATDRKLRLFACACCRRAWDALRDERSRHAVDVAERYADSLTTASELSKARRAATAVTAGDSPWWEKVQRLWESTLARLAQEGGPGVEDPWAALAALTAFPPSPTWTARPATEKTLRQLLAATRESDEDGAALACLVRDVFGNPFRPPPAFDPAWLAWDDGAVARLTQGIYNRRAFDRLPALADALLEAGCDDAELIEHCRADLVHTRGCWALDALLGKA